MFDLQHKWQRIQILFHLRAAICQKFILLLKLWLKCLTVYLNSLQFAPNWLSDQSLQLHRCFLLIFAPLVVLKLTFYFIWLLFISDLFCSLLIFLLLCLFWLTSPSSSDLPLPSPLLSFYVFSPHPPLSLSLHLTHLATPPPPLLAAAASRTSTAPPSPRWAPRPWHHASCCGNSWCGSSFRSRSGGSSRGNRLPSTHKPLQPRPLPSMSVSPPVYRLPPRCQWRCSR